MFHLFHRTRCFRTPTKMFQERCFRTPTKLFCVANATDGLDAGGCPAAAYFLLRGQEKVSKEKAAPLHHPNGCPARLIPLGFVRWAFHGPTAELRASCAQPYGPILPPLRCSAMQRGGEKQCYRLLCAGKSHPTPLTYYPTYFSHLSLRFPHSVTRKPPVVYRYRTPMILARLFL
jgi:hypothetical protein